MEKHFTLNVSTDAVIFGVDTENLNILLVQERKIHPDIESDTWKLPGGLIKRAEDPDIAMDRILREMTGLKNLQITQMKACSGLNRDTTEVAIPDHEPGTPIISIPYYAVINLDNELSSNQKQYWVPLEKVKYLHIIESHYEILERALKALRNELQTSPLVFEFLPVKFTLGHLQKVCEIIFGTKLDKRNFRKKISRMSYIVPLKEKQTGVSHRPAKLYMFSLDMYKKLHLGKNKLLPYAKLT